MYTTGSNTEAVRLSAVRKVYGKRGNEVVALDGVTTEFSAGVYRLVMRAPLADPADTVDPAPPPDPWAEEKPGTVVTVVGTGESGSADEGDLAVDAAISSPDSVAVGADGTLYVVEADGERLLAMDPAGSVTGQGLVHKLEPDGTLMTVAEHSLSWRIGGIAVDADGTIYVGTMDTIRKIDGDGTISTVSGGEPFVGLSRLALDAHGNLYFSEPQGHRVRVLVRPGEIQSSSPWAVAGVAAGGVVVVGAGVVVLLRRRRQRQELAAAEIVFDTETSSEPGV